MMTMWFPIILVLILLAIAAALLVVLVRSCTLPRRVAKGPCCGQCGYSFTGWSICPECGSAVTDVGVETPRMALRYRGSVGLAACVLFLLVLFGGLTTWGIGLAVFDQLGYGRRSSTATLKPVSQAIFNRPNYFAHVALDAEAGPSEVMGSGEAIIAIEVVPPLTALPKVTDSHAAILKGYPHIRVNLTDLRYMIVQPGNSESNLGGILDEAVVKSFLVDSGVQADDEDLEKGASELAKNIRSGRAREPHWSLYRANQNSSPFFIHSEMLHLGPASPVRLPGLSSFATWTLIVAIAFIVLFILALRFVIRRRRRLLTAPVNHMVATPTPPAPAAHHAHS